MSTEEEPRREQPSLTGLAISLLFWAIALGLVAAIWWIAGWRREV